MRTKEKSTNEREDINVNLKLKLASMWTSFMFLYLYIDYFHLYMPGKIGEIQNGRVFEFEIAQGFLLMALFSVTIPISMIFLSVALPVNVNRFTNIIVASVYIPYTLFNLAGEAWIHMVWGAAVEVLLLSLIIRYAWKWPRIEHAIGHEVV